ncbi:MULTISPECIES: GNAT family N-acetyltransferase [unclassified Pseudomonas]|uniref:GNAT family N-acetyltransferase n=1 Tax=unclassified Pseudomonas TaxID=196821 RepID=UPI002AC93DAA|nr:MULTISPECIES: GNAT family N-acetyltransferase [unclassified Pseudomonas]MEB0045587.1 GNAT family N-acetyltransferase [Pseudomonas sp. Dout3]MEB0095470.1 GNAT family N-acetyltransferase [Pseudomonas sp. DC1.2]WPX61054.1 GNAT family N-acetyltransferase [Pseudomonas sp. DC1.2]
MHRTTSRLVLRPPAADDLARLFAIYSDPATNQFNPAGPLSDVQQAAALLDGWLHHWKNTGYGQWAIATSESPADVIGFGGIASYRYNDVERLNLGYRFDVAAWGKGYATELGRASLELGLDELGLEGIWALVRPTHLASIHVLEKIGMQRVDVLDDVPGQTPSLVYNTRRRRVTPR